MNKRNNFETRARLLFQIGEQLIKNESIALMELVKNSYDAGATKCTITFKNVYVPLIIGQNIFTDIINKLTLEVKNKKLQQKDIDIINKYYNKSGNMYKLVENIDSKTKDKIFDIFYFIKFRQPGSEIIIEDNGIGMDENIIRDVWLEIGSDFKEKIINEYKEYGSHPIFKRIPLGEKGIGRFALHKLGNEVRILSKQKNSEELSLHIDWQLFQNVTYLNEVKIEPKINSTPEFFKEKKTNGTLLRILDLKNFWTRGQIREIFRSLNSLNSPFNTDDSFNVYFKFENPDWLKGLLSFDKIKEYSLYKVDIDIINNNIEKFEYKFVPWPILNKINSRDYNNQENIEMKYKDKETRKMEDIDISKYKIGKVNMQLYIFDRDPTLLAYSGLEDKKGFKDYLNNNCGIRIYRDGIRVYDYGEPENDWLNLDIRRVNIPAKRISNNIVIGAIHLNRQESADLIEKANREGFVDNEAYGIFKAAILFAIDKVETQRQIDKEKLHTLYTGKSTSEPVIPKIKKIIEKVENEIKDDDLKKDIIKNLKEIENDFEHLKSIYLRNTSSGLNLSIVIHEIEKIILELEKAVFGENASKHITDLVVHLSKLIDGYTMIIRKSEMKNEDLLSLIKQSIFNVQYRLNIHEIESIISESALIKNEKVKCSKSLIIGSLLNLIDNSIYWLNYTNRNDKKIYFDVTEYIKGFISLIIADNGPGFRLPVEQIVKPFISDKGDGIGLGLHIVSEIINGHNGMLDFPECNDLNIPDEYKNGAIISLNFRR